MSHTNSTTNYNLPQFLGTDKPAWLTDINGAFSTIDTTVKAVSDAATTAGSDATTANTSIGTLSNLNTTEKTNLVGAINEINTSLGTVSGVASDASASATQAKNTADGLNDYLTLTDFNALTASASGAVLTGQNVREAVNADKTAGKVYGFVNMNINNASGCTITIPTSFRPDENMTIAGTMLLSWGGDNSNRAISFIHEYSIATNGNITVSLGSGWYNRSEVRLNFIACMTFFKNFGDTPTPNA